jgi:hypothetical protein
MVHAPLPFLHTIDDAVLGKLISGQTNSIGLSKLLAVWVCVHKKMPESTSGRRDIVET